MASKFAFAAVAGEGSIIDRASGRMEGVSLISEGPALGHGLFVDDRSLETTLTALEQMDVLKSYITHRGAIFDDRMGREIGLMDNFRIEDDQLKGDFQAFESFQEDESKRFNRLFELAEKAPKQFGLSIVFEGEKVWATESGDVEYDFAEEAPEGARFEDPSIRVTTVMSADFVDSPAANQRGLFSQIDIKPINSMTKLELSEKVDALEAKETALNERIEELETQAETFDALSAEKDELVADLATTETSLSEKEEEAAALSAKVEETESALNEKAEAYDELFADKEAVDGKLSEAETEVKRLKSLIDGDEFRSNKGASDYKPGKASRDKRIKEYAAEKGIEEYQAVVELSRSEPELWKS